MRSFFGILVALFGLSFAGQAVCQTAESSCSSSTVLNLTSNWSDDQRELLRKEIVPSIQKRVADAWVKLLAKQAPFGVPPEKVCIEFNLEADGTITNPQIILSSKSALLDRLAFDSLKVASPLDLLPNTLPVKFLTVDYLFVYDACDSRQRYALLSELPCNIRESSKDLGFAVVISFRPSIIPPFSLKECCLEHWAQSVEQKWASFVASSKGKNLVEIEADIEPDGTIANLQMTKPSGNGSIDHAAMESVTETKLAMSIPIKDPLKIRIDLLAHRTPDDVIIETKF